jgi:hypothetical protein
VVVCGSGGLAALPVVAELAPATPVIAAAVAESTDAALFTGGPAPERVVPVLFHYPAHLAPLVEVLPSGRHSDATIAALCDLLAEIGKVPMVVSRHAGAALAPQFHRVLVEEGRRLVASGAATPEQVDELFRAGLGAQLAATGVRFWDGRNAAGEPPGSSEVAGAGAETAPVADAEVCRRMAERARTVTVGMRVAGPTRPAGQVFIRKETIQPFIELAVSEYHSLADYLAGRLTVFPGCWAVLIGYRENDAHHVVRLAHARSVRATDPQVRSEFSETIIPRFGPAYANEARGFWCDSKDLLQIIRQAEPDGLEVLGAVHFHSDWHRIGPPQEHGLHLSEYPTPMDQYMIRNTGWPVHMICYLEQRDDAVFGTLGAWEPALDGDGACRALSVLVSAEAG